MKKANKMQVSEALVVIRDLLISENGEEESGEIVVGSDGIRFLPGDDEDAEYVVNNGAELIEFLKAHKLVKSCKNM